MTVKVLAFDLDGTLLRKDKTVDPRTADAIHRAMDAGMHVVLATGRDRAGCEFVYKPLGLEEGENYLALVNGQILYDFAKKEYDVDDVLTPEDSVKIQNVCRKYGVEGIFCCGYDFYSYLTTPGRVRKQLRRIITGEPGDYGLKAASDVRTFANLPSKGKVITKDINKVCMIHSPRFFEKNLPKLREELKDYDLLMVGKGLAGDHAPWCVQSQRSAESRRAGRLHHGRSHGLWRCGKRHSDAAGSGNRGSYGQRHGNREGGR